jgi:streptogramin lyase
MAKTVPQDVGGAMRRQVVVLVTVVTAILALGFRSTLVGNPPAGRDFLEGLVVNSSAGAPEAGVWVIAETNSLPTPYRKIVVTNDEGKFVVPQLPKGEYQVWVRGYGLKDSKPVSGTFDKSMKLEVLSAGNPQEAAKIFPANYWFSLWQPPGQEELPKHFKSQDEWIAAMKLGCDLCHQQGIKETRSHTSAGEFDAAWRLAPVMNATADRLGRDALAKSLADWGTRIDAGEVPPTPPRPTGLERNIVVTSWQWGEWNGYFHDEVSTDKRNPVLYPNGKIYGLDIGRDLLWALDPKTNTVKSYQVPVRQQGFDKEEGFHSWSVYHRIASPHNPMMDDKGRVWITQVIRDEDEAHYPKWANDVKVYEGGKAPASGQGEKGATQDASQNAEAGGQHHRQLSYFDTNTEKFVTVDTAYGTHHLQFDKEGRLWTSIDSIGLGMFDPSKFDPAHPETEAEAQKLFIKLDPTTGKPVSGGGYGIAVNPADGTVWRAMPSAGGPGNKLNMFDPKTNTFKDFPLPAPGRGPRGVDASTDGTVWFATGSGHLGRLDPRTAKFTYWEMPGPKLKGTGPETGAADFAYYLWVDQFDVLGLGKNMVIVTGTNSDSLLAFNSSSEKWTVIRMPYPLGFFTRGMDGRIDDPNAGWKGRGLWVNYSMDPTRFIEKTRMPYINHVQLRPDPLAH